MNLADIMTVLKDASPWALLAGVILGVVWMYFDYRKVKLEHKQKLTEQSDAARAADALQAMRKQLSDHTIEDQGMLTAVTQSNQQMATAVNQLVQQFIVFNTNSSGRPSVGAANSRMLIQYQWNWCRDETIKIVMSSIERNHINGREQVVAAQVFRAWKRASQEARSSIERFEGLAYNAEPLFHPDVLTKIWNLAWTKALPVYFRDFPDGSGSLDDHKTELVESVKQLFDQTFEDFLNCLYDEDHDREGRDRPSSAHIPANADDMQAVMRMVRDMQDYKPASGKHEIITDDAAGTEKRAMRSTVENVVRQSRRPGRDT